MKHLVGIKYSNRSLLKGLPTSRTRFERCSFRRVSLYCEHFSKCTFIACDFSESYLPSCHFSDCVFSDCLFLGAIVDEKTKLPLEIATLPCLRFFAKKGPADIAGAYLKNKFLCKYRLKDACGNFVNLKGASLVTFHVFDSRFIGANLIECVFDDFTLSSSNFCGADFSASCFNSGQIEGCDFSDAKFRGSLLSKDCQVDEASRLQIVEAGGKFIGPGSDLRNQDLRRSVIQSLNLDNVDLSGSDLRGVFISSTSLRGAKLLGCKVSGARISRQSLEGAQYDEDLLKRAKIID